MKVIEKITRDGDEQTFEIIESRKELAEYLRGTLWESVYSEDSNPICSDEYTTIAYYDKDGKFYWIAEGEKVKRPNISKIDRYLEVNAGSTVIYGNVEIVYNEECGQWQAEID